MVIRSAVFQRKVGIWIDKYSELANACGMACGQKLLAEQEIAVFQSNLSKWFYKGLEPDVLAVNMNQFGSGWKGLYTYSTENK